MSNQQQQRRKSPEKNNASSGGAASSGSPTDHHHHGASSLNATSSGAGGSSGAYKISRAEVEQAFAFFDKSGTGVLRPRDLKNRLSPFYPHMTNNECRFLISEPNFTVDKLWSLLENNTVTNFDPVKEAFAVYDPNHTGYVDTEVLKNIMKGLGYGSDLKPDDLEVLIRTADVDGDGKVSEADFRNMLSQPKS